MIGSELNELELQVDSLIKLTQQVKLENSCLHKKIADLHHENTNLLDKNNQTIASLKKLIMKLQDELLCQTQK